MSGVKRFIADHDYVTDYLPAHEAMLNRDYEDVYVLASDYDAVVARVERLEEVAKDLRERHALTLKECGGCDHSVGICWCDDIAALDRADAALSPQAEKLEKEGV